MHRGRRRGHIRFIEACKKVKGLPYLLLALAAGVLLLLLPTGRDTDTAERQNDCEQYRQTLTQEVERLLCELDGVRHCSVVLTLEQGYSYLYATDQHVRELPDGKETQKTVVLASNGGGEQPLLLSEQQPRVCGIAAVCPGADGATCNRIRSLLCALFALDADRISIQS